ncbi:MAG: beta-ketoacyl-ACP synthase 3, partial [Clostridiales bacterium]|nr:beta-ketoacyl-ACP synthase 3 [Clostridiales bacterium]
TESLTDIAAGAGEQALAQSGVSAKELDLILCATMQGDFVTPSLACTVQKRLGAACAAFDINAACSGFLYGLEVAAGFFARKRVRKVLLIAAECLSKHVDWEDRATCVLFGDGAGAVVLTQGEGLLASRLGAVGNDELLTIGGTPGGFPGAVKPTEMKQTVFMNGQEIYRFAVNAICQDVEAVLKESGILLEEVRYILLHQANQRILDTARDRLSLPEEKVPSMIQRYGNTSASSIPILLDELNRAGRLLRGDLIVLCAFGGGLTTGAAALRW